MLGRVIAAGRRRVLVPNVNFEAIRSCQRYYSVATPSDVQSASSSAAPTQQRHGLSIMSWNVDMSERSSHGVPRRMPRAARMSEIVNCISTTSPDVVCLQDSSPELAAALASTTTSYQLVASTRNGTAGWLQTFANVHNDTNTDQQLQPSALRWTASANPQDAFCTVTLRPPSSLVGGAAASTLRLTNFDLSYKGKALPVATASSSPPEKRRDGLNQPAFRANSVKREAGELDPHRAIAIRHLVDVVQPDIVVGNTFMAASETLHQPLYRDAWAAAGSDPDHELTVNALPIFAPKGAGGGAEGTSHHRPPPQYQTNYFYYLNPVASENTLARPGLVAARRAKRDGVSLSLWTSPSLPPAASPAGAHCTTSNVGRYQRTFIRKAHQHQRDVFLRRIQSKVSFVVLQPWCEWEGVALCPAEQFPTLLLLSV